MPAAAHGLDAAAAQAELRAGLRLRRNAYRDFALQRRHRQLGAQRSLRKADRQFAIQVAAVALEDRMLAHAHFHVEVAGRRAGRAGLALPAQANAVTVVDALGDLHGQRAGLLDASLAVALAAGILDRLPGTAAMRAGLLDREDAVLHAYLAVAMAGRALGHLAVGRAAAVAVMAIDLGRNFDLLADAEHGLLEIEIHDVAQVRPAPRAAAAAAIPSENVAEDVTEDVAHVPETGTATTTHAAFECRMPVLVVQGALVPVGEHLVGLLGLLEFVLRRRVVGATVRMIFHGQPTEGFLQFDFGDGAFHTQHFVVITLAHSASTCSSAP